MNDDTSLSRSSDSVSPLSQPVLVASLPDEGATFTVAPNEAALASLARAFGIPAVLRLAAKVTLIPESRGRVRVEGHVDAVVRQVCVVTLEEFDEPVSEEIDMRFAPADQIPEVAPGAEIELIDEELLDPLVDGTIDVGAVVAEFLALGLDPYPRKPGAEFSVVEELTDEQASPFAGLAKLRDGDKE